MYLLDGKDYLTWLKQLTYLYIKNIVRYNPKSYKKTSIYVESLIYMRDSSDFSSGNISAMFSRITRTKKQNKLFILYYMRNDVFIRFKFSTTHTCVLSVAKILSR